MALEPLITVHHGNEHGNGRAALLQILVWPDILAPRIRNEQAFRAKGLICVKCRIQAVSIEQLRQGRNHRVQAVGQQVAHIDPQDRILRVEHIAAVELVGVLHAVVQSQITLVVVAHGCVEVVAEAVVPDGMRSGHILAVRESVLCAVVRHSEERGEQIVVQGGLALEVLVELVHELGSAVFCRIGGVGRAAVGHGAAQCFAGRCCAVGRVDPLHHITPCGAGHGLIAAVRNVAEGQRCVRVVIALPAGSVCRALVALESVVDMGIVAQLHNALIRARCAVKPLRLFVLLGVAEIAHAVENPLTLCEPFLGAFVVHEHDTRMELHRIAHLGICRPSGADIRLILVEQFGQHGIVHVLAGRNVQLDVEIGFAHAVLGHVVGVGLHGHAVFGVDELALAVDVHIAARLAVGIGGRTLPTVDNALVLPAVLCASAIQEVLHAAAGNLVVLVGREARDTQLDDTQTRPGLCQIVDVGFINGRCVPVGDDVARAIVHRIALIPGNHLVRVGCVRNEVVHHVGIAEADIVELAAVQPHITIRAADGQRNRVALGQTVALRVGGESGRNALKVQEQLAVLAAAGDVVDQLRAFALADKLADAGLFRGQGHFLGGCIQTNAIRKALCNHSVKLAHILGRVDHLERRAIGLKIGRAEQVVVDGCSMTGADDKSRVALSVLLIAAVRPVEVLVHGQ